MHSFLLQLGKILWLLNLLACSPGIMHGIMADSLVDLNTNIKRKNTKPEKNYLFLCIMYHIKATYPREHIDTGMDRKH